jgi:hypothetical protein
MMVMISGDEKRFYGGFHHQLPSPLYITSSQ